MGTINKYSNLYNKDNTVIKSVNENGILTDYSIKELEELVDTLEDGNEKNNAMSMLQKMYMNPKTEEDKKYVAELRNELIEKLKANTSTKKEEVTRALGEVDKEISDDEYVEPISETPILEEDPRSSFVDPLEEVA